MCCSRVSIAGLIHADGWNANRTNAFLFDASFSAAAADPAPRRCNTIDRLYAAYSAISVAPAPLPPVGRDNFIAGVNLINQTFLQRLLTKTAEFSARAIPCSMSRADASAAQTSLMRSLNHQTSARPPARSIITPYYVRLR
ncbi:hypothetical protein KCP75_06615 [Salmonella enterica subsp. enterica]|nr:hypothetical protein KCP75_06615 [Salmonella enterica subsp. enterica]